MNQTNPGIEGRIMRVVIEKDKDGRSGGIRTPDPLVPNQMRYQTALHSDGDGSSSWTRTSDQ